MRALFVRSLGVVSRRPQVFVSRSGLHSMMENLVEKTPDASTEESLNVNLHGLTPNLDTKKLQKIFTEYGVEAAKLKKIYRQPIAKLKFASLDQKVKALEIIRATNLGGLATANNSKILISSPQAHIGPPPSKRNKLDSEGIDLGTQPPRAIADVVNPWHNIPYREQLEKKRAEMEDILKQIVSRTAKENTHAPFPAWLARAKKTKSPACPLDKVIPSPMIDGYRNKLELSAGRDVAGRPCFGFLVGAAASGFLEVAPPNEDCKIVGTPHRSFINNVLNPLITAAALEHGLQPWDKVSHTGFFRTATMRTNRNREALLMIQVNPAGLEQDALQRHISWMSQRILDSNTDTDVDKLKVVSLWVQFHTGVSNAASPDAPLQHIWGSRTVTETLLGLSFQISPTAFFQVNTPGAEVLYSEVRDLAIGGLHSGKDSTVFDVCCGTGTIGLCVAALSPTAKIVGVDIVAEAISDATVNASTNAISNASFIAGKAEDVIPATLRSAARGVRESAAEFVAIVDPPRAGLHPRVIRALREFEQIERLVYVSCNQKSLVNDASALCKAESGRFAGREFEPVSAVAVDLFPHTPHCELIVHFQRRAASDVEPTASVETSNHTE